MFQLSFRRGRVLQVCDINASDPHAFRRRKSATDRRRRPGESLVAIKIHAMTPPCYLLILKIMCYTREMSVATRAQFTASFGLLVTRRCFRATVA